MDAPIQAAANNFHLQTHSCSKEIKTRQGYYLQTSELIIGSTFPSQFPLAIFD
jgi:hypothetical protein